MTISTTHAKSHSIRHEVQKIVTNYLDGKNNISVLEAGCGSASKLQLNNNARIVGLDISAKQLERNKIIDERICADLQSYDLTGRNFDIIICYHVIEHLKNPEKAIRNMISGLKKNGLLILAAPNLFSLKGLVTRFTPHPFHVWFHRNIYGKKDAGLEDTAPFKTYLKSSVSIQGMMKLIKQYPLKIEYLARADALNSWAGSSIKSKSTLLFNSINSLIKVIKILSFNKIADSEFLVVFKKL